ncbi:MAG: methyltransferase family protein [Methanomassiliicoccaceae archaeon]|jgi:protein-S-isoprenylcysteine O-methyltransferase Ste14|nr:isoprenylcysteine carboxylmethyltransferase family protein [Euryarchaeota archaeon]HOB38829.1 isoprenylcysteine carboxylmethyltransferase family protein [Methanomassiliicoccaceae archaeon]HQA21429.1 isoprenylcysteine carboxylmethyltransferase family protein [Methanomassiliicoccaceae archaeon]HQD88405.1 isoprenylcysteine carboxylmethyltransferase family protein [Methanomassiliicoccaceae archaeon]
MEGEDVWSHFGLWWAVAVWIAIYAVFLLFIPFYKKSQLKPAGTFAAFVVAFAVEMFGVPFSMYAVGAVSGAQLPEGILWGHTLQQYIGDAGTWIGLVVSLIGAALVIVGWKAIHKNYWSKEEGKGKLVTEGIYAYIRHPQYTGFFLITFGMMLEWATIPLIGLYILLVVLYVRLAKREEKDMVEEFGQEYEAYRKRTKMFIPGLV